MKKGGVTDYIAFSKDILNHIPNLPISFEVFADDLQEMRKQALQISDWGKNVFVKIPVMNTKGQSTAPLIRDLTHEGVQLNITAVFTLPQVWEICRTLEGGAASFISVFAGRIADTGRDPIPLMQAALSMCQSIGPNIELLWASSREILNIFQADALGCPIITAAPDLIKKLNLYNKDLNELTVEAVKLFKKDADSARFTL